MLKWRNINTFQISKLEHTVRPGTPLRPMSKSVYKFPRPFPPYPCRGNRGNPSSNHPMNPFSTAQRQHSVPLLWTPSYPPPSECFYHKSQLIDLTSQAVAQRSPPRTHASHRTYRASRAAPAPAPAPSPAPPRPASRLPVYRTNTT
jgi:hypothetical protein